MSDGGQSLLASLAVMQKQPCFLESGPKQACRKYGSQILEMCYGAMKSLAQE